MTTEFAAFLMLSVYAIGVILLFGIGLYLARNNIYFMMTKSTLSQVLILPMLGALLFGAVGVNLSGAANTAFLKGQQARASLCELEGETAHPEARQSSSGVIGRHIVACMSSAGYEWTEQLAQCQEAPVAANGYCYLPSDWFGRRVTLAQLALE